MRITEEIGIFRPFHSLTEKSHDAFMESYAMIPKSRTEPPLKSEQPSSKTVMTVYGKPVTAGHLASKLGRYVTYHKSGAVSFRLAEFLRSPRGQEQLRRAMATRSEL